MRDMATLDAIASQRRRWSEGETKGPLPKVHPELRGSELQLTPPNKTSRRDPPIFISREEANARGKYDMTY